MEEGVFLGLTRLIKMVYLVHLAYAEKHKKTYTGFEWFFHQYGPYAREVEEAVKDFMPKKKLKVSLLGGSSIKAREFRYLTLR